ncbi:MAG: CehA/McbA family metallohydrolase [Actinomycetota bacterium]
MRRLTAFGLAISAGWATLQAAQQPVSAAKAELQPLAAQAKRILETLDHLGAPVKDADRKTILKASEDMADPAGAAIIENVFDRYSLIEIQINPESRVKVSTGKAKPELVEHGWRTFLVKVTNEAGVTAPLNVRSPNAGRLANTPKDQIANQWLEILEYNSQPLRRELSGLELEYRVFSFYSRDAGKREARIAFNVGQGTQDIGFRNDVDLLFAIRPSVDVTLRVKDEAGKPTTAGYVIRDAAGRVYPSQAKRLAPDFAFHPQVYRHDGEQVKLPAGDYTVEVTRGPEYVSLTRKIKVPAVGKKHTEAFSLKRWIDPSTDGWFSGDHHIHAAGCAHYTNPTEGVHAPDMMRHCLGEDLKVGANLTWGPCFDYQKQFFTGAVDKVSQYPYLLRYDVEVSGFGSHQSGHLCLLRLKEQMYPGGQSKDHWPTLCYNTLKWAAKQGSLRGPAHSGWGLEVPTNDLPNYLVPPYNGIGANEYIADVTHTFPGPDGKPVPAVDFLSTVDTPYVWELNMWYQTLNCGYRTRISGETDFPCIYGERVGLGRSYVKQDGKLEYDRWCEGIRQGRNYVSDGKSHLIDFRVGGVKMGEGGSELRIPKPGTVRVTANVAALLGERPDLSIRNRPYTQKPYWHIERARIGDTRGVPVEVIVNGYPVARKVILADGKRQNVELDVPIERSSWVAMRVLPSSHTNPVWVVVNDKPVRASRRSAEWCLKGVDQCWSQKQRFIKPDEMKEAEAVYEHARQAYRKILAESEAE